jgi:hypothetical protein
MRTSTKTVEQELQDAKPVFSPDNLKATIRSWDRTLSGASSFDIKLSKWSEACSELAQLKRFGVPVGEITAELAGLAARHELIDELGGFTRSNRTSPRRSRRQTDHRRPSPSCSRSTGRAAVKVLPSNFST